MATNNTSPKQHEKTPHPTNIVLSHSSKQLKIIVRAENGPKKYFALSSFFLFLICFGVLDNSLNVLNNSLPDWVWFVVGSIEFFAVPMGVFLFCFSYYHLRLILNQTHITLTPAKHPQEQGVYRGTLQNQPAILSIKHQTLPPTNKQSLPITNITQFFCRCDTPKEKPRERCYQLMALTKQKEEILLLKYLTKKQALYIEKQLEQNLLIEDQAIKGEVSK